MQYHSPAIPGCTISYGLVAKHVNKKNAGKTSVLAIDALLHSLTALTATFSALAFYCNL